MSKNHLHSSETGKLVVSHGTAVGIYTADEFPTANRIVEEKAKRATAVTKI